VRSSGSRSSLGRRVRGLGAPTRWVSHSTIVSLCLAGVLAISACGSDEEPSTKPPTASTQLPAALAKAIPPPGASERQVDDTFVAALPGSSAQLAVVVQGNDVIVYLCDGKKLGTWLGGKVADDRFDLKGKGVRVTGTVSGDEVNGSVTLPDGKRSDFRARRAENGLGLYRRVREDAGKREVLGWIVTRDGLTGVTEEGTGAKTGVAVSATPSGQTEGTVGSGGGGGGGDSATPTMTCAELERTIDLALSAIEAVERKVQTASTIRQLAALKNRLANLLGQGCE
jgi:hypothetical protein